MTNKNFNFFFIIINTLTERNIQKSIKINFYMLNQCFKNTNLSFIQFLDAKF